MGVTADIPSALRELWRLRAQVVATNVALGSREHREIAHAAALIGQDYHDRFLIELLQNANDQAVRGDLRDSTVVVVRTEALVAVSNGGQPLTPRNLERLSSLADSDKNGVLVGNKGVGFKAVYQITDAPEVYSAAGDRASDDVFGSLETGISLEQHPFRHRTVIDTVASFVRGFFDANDGLARALDERGCEDPVAVVRSELPHVAGFKFPLPRTQEDLRRRTAELRFPEDLRAFARTLVVLPLRDGAASEDVGRAVDRLVGAEPGEPAQAELGLLFLPGVATIHVLDHVRDIRWTFQRTPRLHESALIDVTVSATGGTAGGSPRSTRYKVLRRDALADAPASAAAARRNVVASALDEFGLETWQPDDPLPVVIAVPMPEEERARPLGAPGRFCLGLPTSQSTGLPVHVDARFFATISRTGLDFALPYNAMLLGVAVDLVSELVRHLQKAARLAERRAATLLLHRTSGALADRVYEQRWIAEEPIVLGWDGASFRPRNACALPLEPERPLLRLLNTMVSERPDLTGALPEEELVFETPEVLDSIGVKASLDSPHPWLARRADRASLIEAAAARHRRAGPAFWEPFVTALLEAFESSDLRDQVFLPVGEVALASAMQRVFLPGAGNDDDDEVATVPPRVAASIRVLDGGAMRLREGTRAALTALALRLDKAELVRRPRKVELLEQALFPALADAAEREPALALELFSQAVAWIVSLRDASRKKLDCDGARVPVTTPDGDVRWEAATRIYLGDGWCQSPEHEALLRDAYPERRLVAFSTLRDRLRLPDESVSSWRAAVECMGVAAAPRVLSFKSARPPLESSYGHLSVKPDACLGQPQLEPVYRGYVADLATRSTPWAYRMDHDVDEVVWVDGLEIAERRGAILDLMLTHPDLYLPRATVMLRRVGHAALGTVASMWAFALARCAWPVFPAERGAGRSAVRVAVSEVWRMPEGARRAAYAQLLDVVPQRFSGASALLRKLEVYSVEDAPLKRLLDALDALARRLQPDRLQTRREALSLANELYSRIDDRLEVEPPAPSAPKLLLPVIGARRLECVDPAGDGVVIVFDDDSARARHVVGIEGAYRVPLPHDVGDRIHGVFLRWWGPAHVVRTSTASVDPHFTAATAPEPLLAWLGRTYLGADVAAELAALLTFGGERSIRTEPVSRHWKAFERLTVVFGAFRDRTIHSFYDRTKDTMFVADTLAPHQVVEATWELAGPRSRDVWSAYARALSEASSREFLRDRGIRDVEIIDVADAAGLYRAATADRIAAALHAARVHLTPGTTLDAAASWLASVGDRPEDIAEALGVPELAPILEESLRMATPDGELHLVRSLGIPWALWQAAVLRREGQRYRFSESEQRYRRAREHLVAVAREVAVRSASVHLPALAKTLSDVLASAAPDEVLFVPPDEARAEEAAWRRVRSALAPFDALAAALDELPAPPWEPELPLPSAATRRGVFLYRDVDPVSRQIEATTSIRAVVHVAERLASDSGERFSADTVLGDDAVVTRTTGEWAHVYAALLALRPLLESVAPETVKRLTAVHAFRDVNTVATLAARLGLPDDRPEPPQPKQAVLGVQLTAMELRTDLAAGSAGKLGTMLAEAAATALAPTLPRGRRLPLPPPGGPSKSGGRSLGRPSARSSSQRHEPEFVGDLGEAFVHEWLTAMLGPAYGPEYWVSRARERYGFPASGKDDAGYDFRVPDPRGQLFGVPATTLLIEVKATRTDGTGPFPMSSAEWDVARQCHHERGEEIYVLVRVVDVGERPRIGDFEVDPFAAYVRGEVALGARDFWVTMSPRCADEPQPVL